MDRSIILLIIILTMGMLLNLAIDKVNKRVTQVAREYCSLHVMDFRTVNGKTMYGHCLEKLGLEK